MNRLKTAVLWSKALVKEALADHIFQLSAALAYYSLFSIGPLLVIAASCAGLIFGEEAVRGHLDDELQGLFGTEKADAIQSIVRGFSDKVGGSWTAVLGIVSLVFGASGVFGQLQFALNRIWNVPSGARSGILNFIHDRFLSFAMVMGCAFLLLVSLILTTMLNMVGKMLEAHYKPPEELFLLVHFLFSCAVVFWVFALIFKYLPDIEISWREVWTGAAITAALFKIGEFLLGFYLGREGLESSYGAAGTIVGLLLWVYYAAFILLLGAEITQMLSRRKKPAP